MSDLYFVSASENLLTDKQLEIARKLVSLHGDGYVTSESGGIHINLASPKGLQDDGEIELRKRHLAVNLTKAAAGINYCARCMKSGKNYTLNTLYRFVPLEQRGFAASSETRTMTVTGREDMMDRLEDGTLVPRQPGSVIPLDRLPDSHPAVAYLIARDYDKRALANQFRCTWCTLQNPYAYYRKGPNSLDNTSQSRIIFYIHGENGRYEGWQGRVLERKGDDGWLYYYHPFLHRYERVFRRLEDGSKLYDPLYDGLDIHKYMTAVGTHRNQVLMGLEAAAAYNATLRQADRHVILTEGPLDAARAGPPACATLGKHVSKEQLKRALSVAPRVYYIGQNDEPGRQAVKALTILAATAGAPVTSLFPPEQYNDIGEMRQADFNNWFAPLRTSKETQGWTPIPM